MRRRKENYENFLIIMLQTYLIKIIPVLIISLSFVLCHDIDAREIHS